MTRDLRKEANKHLEKLSKIKVLAFDIDGILTNGKLWWASEEVGFNRASDSRDGYGLKMLMRAGFKVGVISGGDSLSVKKRFSQNLKLDFCYFGSEDKREAFKQVMELGYSEDEILFMGDEFFDIPLLKRSGFSATVPNASSEVKEFVDYITEAKSGEACAREVIDLFRYAREIYPEILDFDGSLINFKK